MKVLLPTFLVAVIVIVECRHTFIGTNVQRPLAQISTAKYSSKVIQKRVENFFYHTPSSTSGYNRNKTQNIQGILAYDMTNSTASANVTGGGIGFPFVNLRMKSERGKGLHYQIYIYL